MIWGSIGMTLAAYLLDWHALGLNRRRLKYFSKPLALLVLTAWFIGLHFSILTHFEHPNWFLAAGITAGLALSLIGDVLLGLPRERFKSSLVIFLLALMAYIIGLSPWKVRLNLFAIVIILAILLFAAVFGRVLIGGLQKMAAKKSLVASVAVYMGVASAMALSATSTLFQPGWDLLPATITAYGGLFFYLSDGLLAYNRFVQALPRTRLARRVLYHLGQLGLVVGVTLQLSAA